MIILYSKVILNIKQRSSPCIRSLNAVFDTIAFLQLIQTMIALSKLKIGPLLTKMAYHRSLLKKSSLKYELVSDSPPIQIKSVATIHRLIMYHNQLQLIPIYLRYYHKFSHPGINRKTNYLYYQKQIDRLLRKQDKKEPILQAKEENKPTEESKSQEETKEEPSQNKESQAQIKDRNIKVLAFVAIMGLGLLVLNSNLHRREPMMPDSAQQLPANIDEETLIAKLFQGLKMVRIKEVEQDKGCQYKISFEYDDNSHQQFRYNGNINNFLAMLQTTEKDKFQKTKVFFDRKQYSFLDCLEDTIFLVTPFLGIAFTIFIFKRFTPDSIMSKLSPKKSFKIEGVRDIKVKFDDVAGMEQAKGQITEFVDFLKNSEKYRQIGAKIPKGALLTGPPGTGKTMLAKATAGEANVPFFYISGSEFVQIFVGMGASKVRELFSRARIQAPSIIFIDEIDAIGKKRQSSRNQEKDSTLNQLLVEMDGFGSHQTVIVLAATNRKDVLDSALTRPGRMDRMVEITLPQIKARQEIFKVHLKPLRIDPDKSLSEIAKRLSELTPGFSGADISNLCNEAAIIAIRKGKKYVQEKDFQDASERITAGYEKKGLANPLTRKRVAYHQAGHAISGWFLKGGDPLVKLTIIPRSKGALGYAQYLPKSTYIITKSDLIDRVAIMLGGVTSEEMHFEQVSSGASDDLQKVYQMSRRMVAQFGMGRKTYNVTVDEESHVRKESQTLSRQLDQQMMDIVKEAQQRCRNVLVEHKQVLGKLAESLLEKETINSEDIKSILGERPNFE